MAYGGNGTETRSQSCSSENAQSACMRASEDITRMGVALTKSSMNWQWCEGRFKGQYTGTPPRPPGERRSPAR